jgi:hypothetical protein
MKEGGKKRLKEIENEQFLVKILKTHQRRSQKHQKGLKSMKKASG